MKSFSLWSNGSGSDAGERSGTEGADSPGGSARRGRQNKKKKNYADTLAHFNSLSAEAQEEGISDGSERSSPRRRSSSRVSSLLSHAANAPGKIKSVGSGWLMALATPRRTRSHARIPDSRRSSVSIVSAMGHCDDHHEMQRRNTSMATSHDGLSIMTPDGHQQQQKKDHNGKHESTFLDTRPEEEMEMEISTERDGIAAPLERKFIDEAPAYQSPFANSSNDLFTTVTAIEPYEIDEERRELRAAINRAQNRRKRQTSSADLDDLDIADLNDDDGDDGVNDDGDGQYVDNCANGGTITNANDDDNSPVHDNRHSHQASTFSSGEYSIIDTQHMKMSSGEDDTEVDLSENMDIDMEESTLETYDATRSSTEEHKTQCDIFGLSKLTVRVKPDRPDEQGATKHHHRRVGSTELDVAAVKRKLSRTMDESADLFFSILSPRTLESINNKRLSLPAYTNGHSTEEITKLARGIHEAKTMAPERLIHHACLHGNIDIVEELINKQSTAEQRISLLNCADHEDGSRPLHKAALGNHFELFRLLVENGALINERDNMSSTPLHWAAAHLNVESIQVLCALGADINTRDRWGYGPFHLAIKKCCYRGAEIILLYGGDVNFKSTDGSTALHMACETGDLESIKWLLNKEKIIANIRDTAGETPLLRAASCGQMEVIEYFLKERQSIASWNLRDLKGQSMIHRAAIYGYRDLLMLIAFVNPAVCAAMMNEGDLDQRTPLHHAVLRKHFREVKTLLTMGANVNAIDKDGNTPLHMALNSGQSKIARFLHQSGANAELKNKRGDTAKMIARRTDVKF